MMAKGKDKQLHIGIFGQTNTGKSSLINVLTQQDLAIVSPEPGTTTDPVKKSIEIPDLGPVVLIDTAGTEDQTTLGQQRVQRTLELIKSIDAAIVVSDHQGVTQAEAVLIDLLKREKLPFLLVINKIDLKKPNPETTAALTEQGIPWHLFSCIDSIGLDGLINKIKETIPRHLLVQPALIGDLIRGGDTVVLVTPIDDEAPEGRLILPQVQLIRDVLDHDGMAVVLKEKELDAWMAQRSQDPALVVTDSQVFPKVAAAVPEPIPMTSFSIVLARQKGNFEAFLAGTPQISKLKQHDKVLLLESCTHQVSCDDIGRVKIPRWISNFTGLELDYKIISGKTPLPENLKEYAMLIQCGGCVMTRRQVSRRLQEAIEAGVPVSNYGMVISYVHGIFNRAVRPFTKSNQNLIEYL